MIIQRKKLIISIAVVIVLSATMIFLADFLITKSTNSKVFSNVDDIHYHKAGLLLGTSKLLNSGRPNRYFTYRIDAAVQLFQAHKIDYIIISGDNSRKEYNEPQDMKEELIKRGIPADRILLDFAGFRTYDSVIRINKIFGQESFTINCKNLLR